MIGPLTSAALRVVPSAQHGIASSLVVVARMTGMLVGVAALSAWGLYRFNQIMATLPKPTATNVLEIATKVAENGRTAYTMQFGEIFFITFIVCGGRRVRVVHRRQRCARRRVRRRFVASLHPVDVAGQQVRPGIAPHHQSGVATGYEHHGNAPGAVVLIRHRVAVGPGDRNREQIADDRVVQLDAVDQLVTRFAMPPTTVTSSTPSSPASNLSIPSALSTRAASKRCP